MAVITFIFFNSVRSYAYDYNWPVDYLIKDKSQEATNNIVESFIQENPEFQFYKRDYHAENESYKMELGICDWPSVSPQVNEALEENGCEKIVPEKVLGGCVYLEDIDSYVYFRILPIKSPDRIILRLTAYANGTDVKHGVRTKKEDGRTYPFNDVEPVKKEFPVKESFEKKFLSKLSLEWEYQDPVFLDKSISKIMSFFRKRKNFIDE